MAPAHPPRPAPAALLERSALRRGGDHTAGGGGAAGTGRVPRASGPDRCGHRGGLGCRMRPDPGRRASAWGAAVCGRLRPGLLLRRGPLGPLSPPVIPTGSRWVGSAQASSWLRGASRIETCPRLVRCCSAGDAAAAARHTSGAGP